MEILEPNNVRVVGMFFYMRHFVLNRSGNVTYSMGHTGSLHKFIGKSVKRASFLFADSVVRHSDPIAQSFNTDSQQNLLQKESSLQMEVTIWELFGTR